MPSEKNIEKTNVMRILDQKKIPYQSHCYLTSGAVSAVDLAAALGEDPAHVFKTLVTVGKSGANYVFMVPAAEELHLKKAAAAVGEKSIEMIKSKELLPLTGYIHGGCSPIGMKKRFPTYLDPSAFQYDIIAVSAGQRGVQVLLSPNDLAAFVGAKTVDLM